MSVSANAVGSIITSTGTMMSLVGSMLSDITGNPILVVVLASGFVGLSLAILRKVFKTSRSL